VLPTLLRQSLVALPLFSFMLFAQQAPHQNAPEPGMSRSDITPPSITIGNGIVSAVVYLPDASKGYYRGARFDWAGVVGSLDVRGKRYFAPWFAARDASVKDVAFSQAHGAYVAGMNSGAVGPVEEFVVEGNKAIGYDEASVGELFLKPGVGWLRKVSDAPYDRFHLYDLVDGGTWTHKADERSIAFTQRLDSDRRYAYEYSKELVLPTDQPELRIVHQIRNLGALPLRTNVYNHNFFTFAGSATGSAFRFHAAFPLKALREAQGPLLLQDDVLGYSRDLAPDESASILLGGFEGVDASYQLCLENRETGMAVQIRGDRPLHRLFFWSLRSVISPEPFIALDVAPGHSASWTITYRFAACP